MRLEITPHGTNKHKVLVLDEAGEVVASEVGDLADGKHRARILELLTEAVPALDREATQAELLKSCVEVALPSKEELEESTPEEIEEAREILRSADLLDQIEADLTVVGIAGEDELKVTLYLLATSRLTSDPLHAIVRGESASGKSWIIKRVTDLIPPEGKMVISHLTPKALYHLDQLGGVKHKLLSLGERSRSDGPEVEDATKAMREFRSDGVLRKTTVIEGEGKNIHLEGPAATVESTTKDEIFNEDANRCLLLYADERPAQTALVLESQAREGRVGRGARASVIRRHHAMQRVLADLPMPATVTIPEEGFGDVIAASFPTQSTEVRRSHELLRGCIKASAILHRLQRCTDEHGEIVATREDYAVAKRLVGPAITAASTFKPTENVERFFTTLAIHVRLGDEFTSVELAEKLAMIRQRVNEKLNALWPYGVIEKVADHEGCKPARWRLSKLELPRGGDFLPNPKEIR